MQQVAVVIPLYKSTFSASEELSLRQVKTVLSNYPIVFICPDKLNIEAYSAIIPTATVKRFSDDYFQNVEGYSRLLLSPNFYKSFLNFEYILIYQTDAYVFRDELTEWCSKGYDYIGAPWTERPPLVKGKPKVDIQNWFIGKVGNGGFSLRKVKSHYNNTRFFRPILRFMEKNEDMFWGLFLYWLNPFFKRPKWQEALHFAIEMNPKNAFELINHQLPFGVHAWEKYDKEFWEEFIR
ncbi:MAG: hypothetical protein NWP83_04800 [Spirosomaceae bacterium]|nr:hypothetical protein [Spirosomataceae bacterium]